MTKKLNIFNSINIVLLNIKLFSMQKFYTFFNHILILCNKNFVVQYKKFLNFLS